VVMLLLQFGNLTVDLLLVSRNGVSFEVQ